MEEPVSIHLYPQGYIPEGFLIRLAVFAASKEASCIWVETAKRSDITNLKKLSLINGIKSVAFLKNTALAIDAIHSGAYALALPYQLVKNLPDLSQVDIKDLHEVYLTNFPEDVSFTEGSHISTLNSENRVKEEKYGKYTDLEMIKIRKTVSFINHQKNYQIEDFIKAIEHLRSKGFNKITSCFFHREMFVSFNIAKLLHNSFGIKTLVSVNSNLPEEQFLYETALVAGSIMSEGCGRGIMILLQAPEDPIKRLKSSLFRWRQLERAIKISRTLLGATGHIILPYTIISCPTCGRCQLDIQSMASRAERIMHSIEKRYRRNGKPLERIGGIKIAIMGCNVNGPGEARDADIGIAGGKGRTGTVFMNGKPLITISEKKLLSEFIHQIEKLINQRFELKSLNP